MYKYKCISISIDPNVPVMRNAYSYALWLVSVTAAGITDSVTYNIFELYVHLAIRLSLQLQHSRHQNSFSASRSSAYTLLRYNGVKN